MNIAFAAVGSLCLAAGAGSAAAQTLSTYGTPGLIDMPTAETLADGMLAVTSAHLRNGNRNTLGFQMLPWAYGTFRYAYIRDFDRSLGLSRYDRSFDVHFQVTPESRNWPALAVGLRDFGGTGLYASEYLVASRTIGERISLTAGLGWGRLASRGGFGNPLAGLDGRFDRRPAADRGGVSTTGQLDFGNWFRGDAALFGGLRYRLDDRVTLMAEYSSDAYVQEVGRGTFAQDGPVNLGVTYRFDNGLSLSGYFLHGNSVALGLSYVIDPREPASPGGQGSAPPALQPVDLVALASWNLPDPPPGTPDIETVLRDRLSRQGVRLLSLTLDGDRARVDVENLRYGAAAQAVGRTARSLANTLPPGVADFDITLARQGVAISTITIRRDDLGDLVDDIDGSWRSLARARIRDAAGDPVPVAAFPELDYRFGPYLQLSFFDPDDPLRYEAGAEMSAAYAVRPGLTLAGAVRQPLASTLDDTTRVSDSVLPRVRSDWERYARESDLRIPYLTGEYIWRPGRDVFGRVTAGYLEDMFGGVSAEMLWAPPRSRLALGLEVNYARQRDFDILFGFRDYDVVTGHASAYYAASGGFDLQVDAGRYLAGDWGATFSVDRRFNNGFKVGAFFTLTDVSAEAFGEGSFDKGIRIEIPLSWLTGRPSRKSLHQTIRPVLRDGGARLNVRNRLFDYTRDARARALSDRWARFFR